MGFLAFFSDYLFFRVRKYYLLILRATINIEKTIILIFIPKESFDSFAPREIT